jgi:hypothetical protein
MRRTMVWITACCLLGFAANSYGQSKQKPGLWEVTSSMSMSGVAPEMPQLPPGVKLPPGVQMPQVASPFAPRTVQMCVTQAMIDKYGGPYSNPPQGDCKVTDIVIKPDGMTAKLVCSGQMSGTGTIQSTWSDANSTKSTLHFAGTMQMESNSQPVNMTVQSTSTYKGPDCGKVKPVTVPAH